MGPRSVSRALSAVVVCATLPLAASVAEATPQDGDRFRVYVSSSYETGVSDSWEASFVGEVWASGPTTYEFEGTLKGACSTTPTDASPQRYFDHGAQSGQWQTTWQLCNAEVGRGELNIRGSGARRQGDLVEFRVGTTHDGINDRGRVQMLDIDR